MMIDDIFIRRLHPDEELAAVTTPTTSSRRRVCRRDDIDDWWTEPLFQAFLRRLRSDEHLSPCRPRHHEPKSSLTNRHLSQALPRRLRSDEHSPPCRPRHRRTEHLSQALPDDFTPTTLTKVIIPKRYYSISRHPTVPSLCFGINHNLNFTTWKVNAKNHMMNYSWLDLS